MFHVILLCWCFLFLTVGAADDNLSAAAKLAHRCSSPPMIENGQINAGRNNLGATRTVVCDAAFMLTGPNMVVCTLRGWTKPGSCQPVSKRFYLVKDAMTWYDAVVRCATAGARLAMPRTAVDNAIIVHLMRQQKQSLAWIGLIRVAAGSRKWRWIDDKPFDEIFQGWLPKEPSEPYERCALIQLNPELSNNEITGDFQLVGWADHLCALNRTIVRVPSRGEQVFDIGAICQREAAAKPDMKLEDDGNDGFGGQSA